MAKVGGRVSWIAWPALLACVGVVGVLLYLAVPAIPGAFDFVGGTLRGGAVATTADRDAPQAEPATDCRSLYPDRLWADLTWTPEVLLSQGSEAPVGDDALLTALAPSVRFSCTWRTDDGRSIQTTVSGVSGDAIGIAQATLSASGFACDNVDGRLHCDRTTGSLTEIHDIVGDTWVASALSGWTPDDYDTQVLSHAVPG